jgi:hypothetical protein
LFVNQARIGGLCVFFPTHSLTLNFGLVEKILISTRLIVRRFLHGSSYLAFTFTELHVCYVVFGRLRFRKKNVE